MINLPNQLFSLHRSHLVRTPIYQLSTLEKTKLCHRPTLSSVLSTSFQQIVSCDAKEMQRCKGIETKAHGMVTESG